MDPSTDPARESAALLAEREARITAETARHDLLALLERITDAFFALDRDWRFTYLNAEAERLLFRGRSELLGRNVWVEFPEAVGSTFQKQYERAMRDGATVEFQEYFPPLEMWFEVRAYPSDAGISVYFRDVTAHRAAQQALEQSEQRFRSLVQATAAIIWTTGPDGVFGGEQPGWSAFTGQTPDEFTGFGWLDAVHPDDRAATVVAWEHAVEARATYAVEHRVRRADGEYRAMQVRATPVLTAQGTLREWVGVHTDVTEQRDLADALRRQTGALEIVMENATSALFMMDGRGRPTFMNRAAEQMTGYTLDEIRHMPLHDAIHHTHPDGSPYPLDTCPIDRALPTNSDLRAHEDVFVRKDGSFFPVKCAASPIFEGGVPVGTVVEVRDVTVEQAADLALRESEQRYRFLGESIPVQVWTASVNGRLDYVNRRCTEYFGMSADALIGDNWQSVLHPDDAAVALRRWTRSLETGEPYQTEFRLRAAAGEYRWHLARGLPLREPDGGIVHWFGSNTDIHDQKLLEAARVEALAATERSRAELHRVFAQSPAAILVTRGPDHVPEIANPLYRELVSRTDLLGRPLRESFPELASQGFFELLDEVYRTGNPYIGNEVEAMIDRNGDSRPQSGYFNFVYQPLLDPDGRVYGIMTHAVEVTGQVEARREAEHAAAELRRTTHALERSNSDLDQFAYVASHDLKAPLRGIANLSEWIEEAIADTITDETRQHMTLLRGRVRRLESLIDGILLYSRSGRRRATPEPVDVGALVSETVDMLAPPDGVQIHVETPLPTVTAERVALQQVFMNLIGNAIKHGARDGGNIRVAGSAHGDFVEFTVSDDGRGIAPEYHDRIWGIFQMLEARDKVEGTGIGLAVVKRIVEARGGTVEIESDSGKGATFRVRWPAQSNIGQ